MMIFPYIYGVVDGVFISNVAGSNSFASDNNDAVNKIIEIASKNTKTYILAIGAITNVAIALKKKTNIVDKIEEIWLGGHSLLRFGT